MYYKVLCFVILSLLSVCHAGPLKAKERILNGTVAEGGMFPYMASLQNKKTSFHYCGASIINKRYLLTAAHCLEHPTYKDENGDKTGVMDLDTLKIVVGINRLDDNEGITLEAEKLINHEKYNIYQPTHINQYDIGLIRLNKDIEFNDRVQPIKLITSKDDYPKKDEILKLTGWGISEKGSHIASNDLLTARLLYMNAQDCEKRWTPEFYNYYLDDGMMCTVSFQIPDSGDSGSPLVNDRGIQVGVFVTGLGIRHLPNGYTDVLFYADWIAEHSKISDD
ncbi:hypothetical protein TKK_0013544 [Trichogramma kaykai]|uniref:Peptidase S1 domain-containing protein n=1 Tax=Trichogramma kaykai TaxID=54128 RepID=A0ABD2WIZ5_9HYME